MRKSTRKGGGERKRGKPVKTGEPGANSGRNPELPQDRRERLRKLRQA